MKLTSLPTPATVSSPATQPATDPQSATRQLRLARALEAVRVDSRDSSEEYLDETVALHGGE
jgi:hypothetical protein